MRRFRSSIAGLMVLVLATSVGLAALRGATPAWAGAIGLLTYGWLGVAIVGALYRRGSARAWWLGFAVFGCGYMLLGTSSLGVPAFPGLPLTDLLNALWPVLGHTEVLPGPLSTKAQAVLLDYYRIGHSLGALAAGWLGGTLARAFRDRPAEALEEPAAAATATAGLPARGWARTALAAWMVLLLACAAAAIRGGREAGSWAGAAFFLTCGLLGLSAIAAIYGRGRRRQVAVGAALFGIGYLLLAFGRAPYQLSYYRQIDTVLLFHQPLPMDPLLDGLRRWTRTFTRRPAAADARILAALEQPVPMTFPEPTPLQDVLRYAQMATSTPTDRGIPIYLDPVGLQEAEKTPTSPVTIDLEGVPLGTSLRLALEQLGLDYRVKDGVLQVTTRDNFFPEPNDLDLVVQHCRWLGPGLVEHLSDLDDPFLTVGHCLLALAAAGVGALAAPIVAGAGRETAGRRSGPVSDAHTT